MFEQQSRQQAEKPDQQFGQSARWRFTGPVNALDRSVVKLFFRPTPLVSVDQTLP